MPARKLRRRWRLDLRGHSAKVGSARGLVACFIEGVLVLARNTYVAHCYAGDLLQFPAAQSMLRTITAKSSLLDCSWKSWVNTSWGHCRPSDSQRCQCGVASASVSSFENPSVPGPLG